MELFDLFIAVTVGGVLGAIFTQRYVAFVAKRFREETGEEFARELISQFREHVIVGYSEITDGVIRLYSDEHTFLAQGRTIDELTKAFVARYPGKRFVVTPNDGLFDQLTQPE